MIALIGAGQFKAESLSGQRVEARGLLGKDPRESGVDLLSLSRVGACSN